MPERPHRVVQASLFPIQSSGLDGGSNRAYERGTFLGGHAFGLGQPQDGNDEAGG